MGHKGVSKRKLPKIKTKPLASAKRGSGAVSDLAQSERLTGQLPGKGGAKPLSGSKKK